MGLGLGLANHEERGDELVVEAESTADDALGGHDGKGLTMCRARARARATVRARPSRSYLPHRALGPTP